MEAYVLTVVAAQQFEGLGIWMCCRVEVQEVEVKDSAFEVSFVPVFPT